jgi:riboflavin-specific deaminase-like protein
VKRPHVIANFAITADGKVSTRQFTPTGFTRPADKRRLLDIRARGDALLVGAGTVAADSMTMRLPAEDLRAGREAQGRPAEPLRVMISNRGNLDPGGKVFREGGAPRVVFSTGRMPEKTRARLAPLADLWLFESGTIDLPAALQILRAEYRVRTLVCEGGPTLFRSLLEIEAVDELHLTWAGLVFGGAKAPTLTGLPGNFLPRIVRARLTAMESGDGECYLTYRLKWPGTPSSRRSGANSE